MKITVDTNVLVKAAVIDDKVQAAQAVKVLQEAELITIPSPVFCEFVWVLSRGYGMPVADIAGGDFADGVIAYEGEFLGGAF